MQQHWLLLTLLVVLWSLNAHGKQLQLNKDFVTSLLSKGDAVRQTGKSNLNLDNNIVTIQAPSSAVQDWSLVCQQLCGATLGGAVCAPYCKNLPFLPYRVQLENTEEIMESKKDLMCPHLCELQLGDDFCTCKDYITNDLNAYVKSEQQTNVCAIICDYNSVTLTGCTPCNKDKNVGEYMILENVKNFNQQQVVPYGAIDTKTTTTTTPDWNQLCASLCKTGDGGSLCNCDLSPFFI